MEPELQGTCAKRGRHIWIADKALYPGVLCAGCDQYLPSANGVKNTYVLTDLDTERRRAQQAADDELRMQLERKRHLEKLEQEQTALWQAEAKKLSHCGSATCDGVCMDVLCTGAPAVVAKLAQRNRTALRAGDTLVVPAPRTPWRSFWLWLWGN